MILKQEDFRYPTKDEISKFSKEFPRIEPFQFKRNSIIQLWIEYNLDNEQLLRIDNLSNWDICLHNRFGKLTQTFEYLFIHFNRGISENYNSESPQVIADTFLFEYYVEIFYYFYFSSLDVIAQIINLYFRLIIDEKKIDFGKIINCNIPIKPLLVKFNNHSEIINARNNRKAFTHRYTPTMNDRRASYVETGDNRNVLGIGGSKQINFESILKNSKEIMIILSQLMRSLIEYIKKDTDNNAYLYIKNP